MEKPKASNWFLFVITLVSVAPLLSSDIYIPSLPTVARDLGVTTIGAQMTLSLFLLGLASFQLIYGPLSDRFGRRPVLLTGFSLYALSTFGCALAPSLPLLIVCRFFQAVGVCAGLVVGRAIISDRFSREEAASVISFVYPFVALSPAIAPFLGGHLSAWFGWRGVFYSLFGFSLALLALVFFKLPESKAEKQKDALKFQVIGRTTLDLFSDRRFVAYALTIVCAYGAYFAFLSGSPFLFETLGLKASETGSLYVPLSLAYFFSTLIARRFLPSHGIDRIVLTGCYTFTAGAALMVVLALNDVFSVPGLLIPMAIVTMGNGMILSFSMAGAISVSPGKTGVASGLAGTCQLLGASLGSSLVGLFSHSTSLPMGLILLGFTAAALVGFRRGVAEPKAEKIKVQTR